MTPTAALQQGRATLVQAASELGMPLSEQAIYWLLGQAYRENGLSLLPHVFGSSTEQFLGTNNWGSVYWPSDTTPANPFTTSWKPGKDYDPSKPGKGGTASRIAVYPTQLDGAKGFLQVVKRYGQEALNALAGGSVTDFSRALYKRGYYVGYHCGQDKQPSLRLGRVNTTCASDAKLVPTQEEADALNIRDYANLIQAGANEARKANLAPLEPVTPFPAPAPRGLYGPSSMLPLLALAAAGGAYVLTRKEYRLLALSKLRFT